MLTQRGRRAQHQLSRGRGRGRVSKRRAVTAVLATVIVAAITIAAIKELGSASVKHDQQSSRSQSGTSTAQRPVRLPAAPGSYLGLYVPDAPVSYAGLTSFTESTGIRPNLVSYYSGWFEPFQTRFAEAAAEHHAVPLVQIDPTHISLAAIAAGRYDAYLTAYAKAVRSYRLAVVLSFGHEMNGSWYSWGYRNTAPAEFVAAWRHVVTVFRSAGATNATWLWTANVFQRGYPSVTDPAPWWPGQQYVTWVGIDGYYSRKISLFAELFGPTIAAVREFTDAPILISETGALHAAGQPAKIAGLFAGIRTYQLLGFIWFDANTRLDYQITSPAAFAAFRRGARAYRGPVG
jgi:mannan endo-1,4-beta-mannosidase